jgi:putative two-component system response regulator
VDLHPRYDRLDQTRHAAVQYTLQKYIGSPCPENWFSLTSKALPGMVQALRFLFDAIRLVDITTHQAYSVTRQGELMPDAHPCFALWGRDVVCDYCLSESVTRERARMSKFEFQGDDVYHVIAIYVEVDGQPRSMEMLTKITPTAIARAGLNQADGFPPHDSRLYIDPLTRVFNRQYYEETLRDAPLTAVAMVDVDNFKEINDQYGHLAGDMVLAAVASAISTSIRSADDVARYGGDEFALVFQSIPADIFRLRLEKIRGVIQELHLDQFPDLHITVSIGGLHGPGVTWHRLHQADLLLSKAKKQKNRVCIMVEAPDESIPTL